MKKPSIFTSAFAAAAMLLTGTGMADTLFSYSGGITSSSYLRTGYSIGSGFNVTAGGWVVVTALEVQDPYLATGTSGSFVPTQVGLWDSGGNLLASATVTASSPTDGTYRYATLNQPVTLPAGSYVVGADTYDSGLPFLDGDNGSPTLAPYSATAGIALTSNLYVASGGVTMPPNNGGGDLGRWAPANALFSVRLLWNAGVNYNWDTATTNWSGSVWTNGGDAFFGATGVGTVNLGTGVTANSLSFNTPGYIISGGTLTLTGSAAIVANSNAAISTVLAGNGLAKSGTGTLTLTGINTVNGNTTLNGGVLDLTQGVLYGGGYTAVTITVGSGAVLQLAGDGAFGYATIGIGLLDIGAGALVINGGTINFTGTAASGGGRDFTIGSLGATFQSSQSGGAVTISGGYAGVITDNSSLTLTGTGTGGAVLNQNIIGTGSLIKNGSGTWTLSGSNTYTGATTVSSGTLCLTGGSYAGAMTVASGAVLSVAGPVAMPQIPVMAADSALNFGLGSVVASGQIQMTGTYAAPASPVGITVSAANSLAANLYPTITNGVYNLITGAPGISADSFVINSAPAGYACTLSASNGTLSLNVAASASIPTIPLGATAYPGSAFSYQIPPVTNSTGYGATGLPPGVTLNPGTGLISGTPTDPGTYFATVTSSNAGGTAISQLIIVVPPAEGTPALSTAVPRGCFNNVAESGSYTLVYSLSIPSICNFNSSAPAYSVDTDASVGSFSRVAYYLELQAPNGTLQYVWASMNPFTSNAAQIGVPTTASGANFQQAVTGLNVVSNVAGVVTGTGLSGNISFSPLASGSMAISNVGGTLFGFANWGGSSVANVGIGGPLVSATDYSVKSLQVYVLNSDTTQTVQPVPDNTTFLLNPGKGWVDATGFPLAQVSGIVYASSPAVGWTQVEPSEGVYDWSIFDNIIAANAPYGIKLAPKIPNSSGTPAWVFQPGTNVQTGSVYTTGAVMAGDTDLPASWDDPVYVARMKEMIAAFGQYYNGNPNVGYVPIEDTGGNGEGIFAGMTLDGYENSYVAPYIAAFPNTRMVKSVNGYAGVEYFEDGTPSTVGYQWSIDRGVGLGRNGICSSWDTTYASELLLAYPYAPVYLEYAYTWADTVALGTDPNSGLAYASPGELLKYVLGGRGTYVQLQGGMLQAYPNFCDMLGNLIGYYFTLQQATIPKTIQAGVAFPLSLTWLNNGVAPAYESCYVAVALLDSKNNPVQQQWLTTSNPNGWMPGVSATENFTVTFPSVPVGYKLAVGLYSNQTDVQPSYRLGNQGRTITGWYILSGTSVQPAATWTNPSGGSWQTDGNWTASSYTSGIDVTADFSTQDLTSDATVTLDGNVTVGNLLFGDTTPSNNWILGSGTGGTLTLRATRGMATITVNNQTTTIIAPLINYVGLAKNGAGTLALTNAELFYGNVTINGGVLDLTQGELYGGYYTVNTITVGSGAVLQLAGFTSFGWGGNPGIGNLDLGAASLVINGGTINATGTTAVGGIYNGRDFTVGPLGATFQSSQSGGTFFVAGYAGIVNDVSSLTLTGNGTGGAIFQSSLTGTGTLIKNGSGTWTLTAANTYSGSTTVNAGSLVLGGSTAMFGSNSAVTLANVSGALLSLAYNNGSATVGASPILGSLSGGGAAGGNVELCTGALTVGTDNTSTTYSGTILSSNLVGNNPNGIGAVIKTGAGIWTLSGTGSYQGATTVNQGTLCVNGRITSPAVLTVAPGATLSGTGTIASIVNVNSGGTISPDNGTGGAGVLTLTGTLALAVGGNLNFNLGGSGSSGSIRVTGAYVTPSGQAVINIGSLPGFGVGTYNLITGATGISARSFVLNTVPAGYNYALSASNGTLSFIVEPTPAITSALSVTGISGNGFSYQITAGNSPTGFGAANLPPGLFLNSTNGLISGIPTAIGTYNVTLTATNASGPGSATLLISVLQALPPPPVITSALNASGNSGSAFSYQITASNGPVSFAATGLPSGISVNAGNGLIGGSPTQTGTYNTTISAINAGGTGSATLTIVVKVPSPVITSALGATGTIGSAFSYQIAASNNPTSYGAINLPAGLSVNTGTGLINGTPTATGITNATMSAINAGGTGSATLVINILPAPPSAPTGLSATGGNASVSLSWTASSGAASYNIQRSPTSGSGFTTIASGVATTAYTDYSVSNGTTYYYEVAAVNTGGASANSTQASAMPSAPVALPSPWANVDVGTPSITGTSIYEGGNTFVVKGAGGGIGGSSDAFQFAYVTTTSTSITMIARVTTPPTGSTQVGLMMRSGTVNNAKMAAIILSPSGSSYKAQFGYRSSSSVNWSTATTGLAMPEWLKIIRSGSTYTGYICSDGVSWKSIGTGTNSNIIGSGSTAYYGLVVSSSNTGSLATETFDNVSAPGWTAPPGAPSRLTATAASQTQINLSWTAVSGATGYQMLRSGSWSGTYSQIGTSGSAGYTDSGLSAGTGYYYMVRATSGSGTSGNSLVVSGTTQPNPPAAPSGLSATGSNGAVLLSWSALSSAASYNVSRSLTSGSGYTPVANGVSGTSYSDTGVNNGTPYYYVVSAVNAGGVGANSTEASATPEAPPVFTCGLSATGTSGSGFNFQISATNNPTVFSTANLPAGLGINPGTGLISGTPTSTGTTNVTIGATNNGGAVTATWTITVLPPPPAAPAGFTAVAGNAQVALSWSAAGGATGYSVKRSTVSGSNYTLIANTATTGYTDSAVSNWIPYYYVVSALNAGGEGPNSIQTAATPQSPVISGTEQSESTKLTLSGSNSSVTFSTSVIGHTYQLQYVDSLTSGTWTNYGSAQPGTGGNLIFPAPYDNTVPRRFYRLQIWQ